MMPRPIEFWIMTNLHDTTYAEVRSIWQTAEREGSITLGPRIISYRPSQISAAPPWRAGRR
jgi:hypothetical protein